MTSVIALSMVRSATANGGASGPTSLVAGATGAPAGTNSTGGLPEAGATSAGSASALPTGSATTSIPIPDPKLKGYVWPLPNGQVTLPFGPSSWGEFFVNGERFHDGVDMATQCGDNVLAAHDGIVLAASREYDVYMGWTSDIAPYYHLLDTKHWWNSLPIVIVINDGNGYRSIYAHEEKVVVKPGQHVKAGQILGWEGQTGNATGCHVHYGLFSPTETATFQLDPAIVAKDLMPPYETARVNPLLVLPFRCDVEEMRTLRPAEAVDCPPLPSASPAPSRSIGPSVGPSPTARPKASA
jgi:murein DD-endopeptidase MepM/ murein hydrolase activator NlpD